LYLERYFPPHFMHKRLRMDMAGNPADPHHSHPGHPGVTDDAFINDRDAVDSGADDDEDDEKPKSDKKAGRRKIKIEFIQDKSRRHITFSKRKAGIMKKAYELSTLTGTQVLLLVVSETGLVYTFTTAKLQPLVTQPEGKNLIQACLNAPHGSLPSSMPVGQPLGRSSNLGQSTTTASNMPGGLSIGSGTTGGTTKDEDESVEEDEAARGGRAQTGDKRRRRASSNAGPPLPSSSNTRSGPNTSPHQMNSSIPAPHLTISSGTSSSSSQPPSAHPGTSSQMPMGASPTSPQQGHAAVPGSNNQQYPSSYAHHSHHASHQQSTDGGMYGAAPPHMMPTGGYSYAPGNQTNAPGNQQQLGGLAAAAAQHGHWGTPQQQQQVTGQGAHYSRR
jgi:pheromone receptor transcription factor